MNFISYIHFLPAARTFFNNSRNNKAIVTKLSEKVNCLLKNIKVNVYKLKSLSRLNYNFLFEFLTLDYP